MSDLHLNIGRAIFGPNPKPGEWYVLDDRDPFAIVHKAEILEVRDGYVKYMRWIGDHGASGSDSVFEFKLFWKKGGDES